MFVSLNNGLNSTKLIYFSAKYCKRLSYSHKKDTLKQEHNQQENSSDESQDFKTDPLKIKILHASLKFVPELGWNERSLAQGAKSLGLSSAAHSLIENGGPDLVHFFNFSCNVKLEEYLKEISSTNQKFDQEFIKDALEYRLRMVIPYVPKWPEAMGLMAAPTQLPTHTRNVMDLVDIVWHFYGDKSLDLTWYSKRIILAGAYKAAELSLIQDKSPEFTDTFDFLERRIENVMEAHSCMNSLNENRKQLVDLGEGAFVTVRNLLGLNRWRR